MSEIADILGELDFEQWLSHEGVQHKLTRGKSGVQANIRECPHCHNTKWKVYFGVENGVGNCFVCEKKFTKWSFIRDHLNVSNADTFAYIKDFMSRQGWKPKVRAVAKVALPPLQIPPSFPLPIKGKNLQYLENRGIGLDLAQHFHLRYCHNGLFHFKDHEGQDSHQDYSRRVIIPVFDIDGQLVSFQGRDITGESAKRYLFPPGYASTGSVVYNAHNAKESSRVILGEGAFDAFAIKAAIDEDKTLREATACATFGKKLAPDQLGRLVWLKEHGKLKEVIFMWDSEREALEAAVVAALKCRAAGLSAKIAFLPPGKDPNEVPPSVVREAIWSARVIDRKAAIELLMAARKLQK